MIKETLNVNQSNTNRSIQAIVATLGVIFGFGGMGHGFFEMLQGNNPTGGFIIDAIGEANRLWAYGNEPAFTVIPNFLISGIATILVGIAVIIWSAGFMNKKHAPSVFLALFIALFLVGGGIAQVIFFTIVWAFSTRIRKPLNWWKKSIPEGLRRFLLKLWLSFLIISSMFILYTLQIAILGFVPGVSDPDGISMVMVSTLGVGLAFLLLAFISGCANDIQKGDVIHG